MGPNTVIPTPTVSVDGHDQAPYVFAPGSTLRATIGFTPDRDCAGARVAAALRVFVPIVVFAAPLADVLVSGGTAGAAALVRIEIRFPPEHPDYDGPMSIAVHDAAGLLTAVDLPIRVR